MLGIAILINMLLLFLIFLLLHNPHDVVKSIILGITVYFLLFVIISGVYFAVDKFSFFSVTVTCLVISVLALCAILLNKRPSLKTIISEIKPLERNSWILVILLVAGLILTVNKFGFWGMGQDQGVYQTKAIELINGDYADKINLHEYYNLSNADDQALYMKSMTKTLVGLYQYDTPLPARYHGIPTFPALLAVFGKIFGTANMMQVLTIFFLLGICLIWLICDNLKLRFSVKVFAAIIFMFSPIILWVSKSALTEMFLIVIILSFIYFLTSLENKISQIMLCVPVIVFSFYHVSIYTIMPLFFLLYAYLLVQRRTKLIFVSAVAAMVGYAVGFYVMILSSPSYTFNNYSPIYAVLRFLNNKNLPYFVIAMSVIAILLLCIIYFKKLKFTLISKIVSNIIVIRCFIILMLVLCIINGFKISFADPQRALRMDTQGYFFGRGLIAFKQISLYAYMFSVGVIPLIAAVYFLFKYAKTFLKNINYTLVCIVFGYCVLLYCAVIRKQVDYYYYYDRYLAPFVSFIILLAGMGFNVYAANVEKANVEKAKEGKKRGRQKKPSNTVILLSVLSLLSCVIVLPNTALLVTTKDETFVSWNVLEDFAKQINKNDIVLIDTDSTAYLYCMRLFYLPIRSMTGADVYPDLQYQDNSFLKSCTGSVYIITSNDSKYLTASNRYKIVLKESNVISRGNTLMTTDRSGISPYPPSFFQTPGTISLLKMDVPSTSYDFSKDNFQMSGFSLLESTFRWTVDGDSSVYMSLHQYSYNMTITLGPQIPSPILGKDNISVDFYMNGNYIGTKSGDDLTAQTISLNIPQKYVIDGANEFEIKYNTWSPTEYGSSDTRQLGISLAKIELEPIND